MGICTRCGKEDAYTIAGRKLCHECCEENRERGRQYFSTDKGRAIQRESRKRTWAKREAEGLCVRCGKRPPKQTSKMCAICTIKQINYNRMRYREKNDPNYPRGANGICYQCNKRPAEAGKRLCPECCVLEIEWNRNRDTTKARERKAAWDAWVFGR